MVLTNVAGSAPSPNKIVVPSAGIYHVHSRVSFSPSSVGYRQLGFYQNETRHSPSVSAQPIESDGASIQLNGAMVLALSGGDEISVYCRHLSDGTLDITSGSTFSVYRVADKPN